MARVSRGSRTDIPARKARPRTSREAVPKVSSTATPRLRSGQSAQARCRPRSRLSSPPSRRGRMQPHHVRRGSPAFAVSAPLPRRLASPRPSPALPRSRSDPPSPPTARSTSRSPGRRPSSRSPPAASSDATRRPPPKERGEEKQHNTFGNGHRSARGSRVARAPSGPVARGFDSRRRRCAIDTTTATVPGRDTDRAVPAAPPTVALPSPLDHQSVPFFRAPRDGLFEVFVPSSH